MQHINVYMNINKERRALFNTIKMMAIRDNGIIYGGLVRDEIIATYNKELYDEYIKALKIANPYNKYWDENFHIQSKNRVLIPNDIDIYFHTNQMSNIFLNNLNNYINIYNGKIRINNENRTSALFYTLGHDFQHKKVKIIFYIGRTFIFSGYKIEINIDIIINNSSTIIEPPFNTADFTCNLFIMIKTEHNDKYEIRLSRNTGTPLDIMTYIQKRKTELTIIDNMVNGNIEFIRNVPANNCEYINGMRILKMLKNKLSFKITNLLFEEITDNDPEFKLQDCDICIHSVGIAEKKEYIKIKTNKHGINIMHKDCFIKYLETEVFRKYVNIETNMIECRCTRRNLFNFKDSYKYSSLYQIDN